MGESQSGGARERQEIYFSGRVQGVGFRYTTRDIAGRFQVSGFVQNLHDGRVLLVVEGESEEVARFVASLAAEMERFIVGQETSILPATGEFHNFSIRH